jgi:aminomethyltransferase
LNEDGIIIDDVVVMRLEENKYWISTLYIYKLIEWLNAQKGDYQVEYKDVTGSWDMYSVQGPKSKELLNSFIAGNIDDQKFFTIRDNKIGDVLVKIARAGFAGEKIGYEIYVAPAHRKIVEEKLSEHGKDFGAMQVTELQIMIWTLPTEKGFYLMVDLRGTNPFEVGLDRGIDWGKDFIGKDALERIKAEGPKRQLLGFTVDNDEVYIQCRNLSGPGAAVMLNEQEIGRVTKFTYGFTVDKNIGYALIDIGKATVGDMVDINGFEALLTDKVFC